MWFSTRTHGGGGMVVVEFVMVELTVWWIHRVEREDPEWQRCEKGEPQHEGSNDAPPPPLPLRRPSHHHPRSPRLSSPAAPASRSRRRRAYRRASGEHTPVCVEERMISNAE